MTALGTLQPLHDRRRRHALLKGVHVLGTPLDLGVERVAVISVIRERCADLCQGKMRMLTRHFFRALCI